MQKLIALVVALGLLVLGATASTAVANTSATYFQYVAENGMAVYTVTPVQKIETGLFDEAGNYTTLRVQYFATEGGYLSIVKGDAQICEVLPPGEISQALVPPTGGLTMSIGRFYLPVACR